MKKLFFILLLLVGTAYSQTAQVGLNWTAVGDDSLTGTASQYDLRWSTDSTALVNNWATCTRVTLVPPPLPSGGREYFLVTGLPSDTLLFFAIKVADERPNWSGMSNIVRYRTPDVTPPARITDLKVE
jgi:hypothetical protein